MVAYPLLEVSNVFVRNARFEGARPEKIDERVSVIKENLAGSMPAGMDGVKRVIVLVNREEGLMANLVFCETQAELEAAHEVLNTMSPGEGGGQRTSVEMYEVALDESVGS